MNLDINNETQLSSIDVDSDSDESENNRPENHPLMKNITSNWKLIGIISAFINRCVLEKVDIHHNHQLIDKKIITHANTGDPTILNVTNVDVYNLNLFRQVHQSFDSDLKYLKSKIDANIDTSPKRNWMRTPDELTEVTNETIEKLLIGMTTLNEQIANFIADGCENLYDQKLKKIIEYFYRQRDYYISIGRIKIKYNDKEQIPESYESATNE